MLLWPWWMAFEDGQEEESERVRNDEETNRMFSTGCDAQVVDNWRRLDEWALFSGITLHASVRPISHWAVLCLCPGQNN